LMIPRSQIHLCEERDPLHMVKEIFNLR
jgi:hypothetical protein